MATVATTARGHSGPWPQGGLEPARWMSRLSLLVQSSWVTQQVAHWGEGVTFSRGSDVSGDVSDVLLSETSLPKALCCKGL